MLSPVGICVVQAPSGGGPGRHHHHEEHWQSPHSPAGRTPRRPPPGPNPQTPGHQRQQARLKDRSQSVEQTGQGWGLLQPQTPPLPAPSATRCFLTPFRAGSASSQTPCHLLLAPGTLPRSPSHSPLVSKIGTWNLSLTGPRNTFLSLRRSHKNRARFCLLISRLQPGPPWGAGMSAARGPPWTPKVGTEHRGQGHQVPEMAQGTKTPSLPSSPSPLSSHPRARREEKQTAFPTGNNKEAEDHRS